MSTISLAAKTSMAAAVAAASLNAPPGSTATPPPSGTALTIYSRAAPGAVPPELYRQPGRGAVPGYAVVRQERDLDFTKGRNAVRFTDVAALIDPTTVVFESLTDPQGHDRARAELPVRPGQHRQAAAERYLDRPITVEQVRGQATETFNGTLLSTQGGLVLQARRRQRAGGATHNAGVKLPALPGGLITRPTLVWDVNAQRGGAHRTRVSYQTQGMTWWSDYNVIFAEGDDANSGRIDVGAWVSIINQSGAELRRRPSQADRGRRAPRDHRRCRRRRVSGKQGPAQQGGVRRLRGESLLRVPPVHARAARRPCPTTRPSRSSCSLPRDACRARSCWSTTALPTGYRGFLPSPVTDRNFGVQGNQQS